MDLTGFLEILEHYLGSGNALSAQLDLETKLNNQSLKHMLHSAQLERLHGPVMWYME